MTIPTPTIIPHLHATALRRIEGGCAFGLAFREPPVPSGANSDKATVTASCAIPNAGAGY
ncbi:MAG TPA: hypothetical protein VHP82_04115 [Gaiellaceae bacterium]|jgi:hypothetical protein|nr:hypothetical protein [Gaiellaceae bacterium]